MDNRALLEDVYQELDEIFESGEDGIFGLDLGVASTELRFQHRGACRFQAAMELLSVIITKKPIR